MTATIASPILCLVLGTTTSYTYMLVNELPFEVRSMLKVNMLLLVLIIVAYLGAVYRWRLDYKIGIVLIGLYVGIIAMSYYMT